MSVEMQKESEADSGLYSDINRSLGRDKKSANVFIFYQSSPGRNREPKCVRRASSERETLELISSGRHSQPSNSGKVLEIVTFW